MLACQVHGVLPNSGIVGYQPTGSVRTYYCIPCFMESIFIPNSRQLIEHQANEKASLDKPTGTAEKITVDKTLEQASSVSATYSFTVGKAHG